MNLTIKEARHLIIGSQFFTDTKLNNGKKDLLKIIEHLGYIQIDTISVVERSHNHILWSRMPHYKRSMLSELVENDRSVFEYWSHAAAFLPMRDFRFSLIRKKNYREKYSRWGKANKKVINFVYDRIKNEGALQSKDFVDKRASSAGWWEWKPSKDALDFLFHQGKLMIAGRRGFQKVYDLTERVLPDSIDTRFPDEKEFYEHLIMNSINSNGLVLEKEITYLRKYNRPLFKKALSELLEEGKILKAVVKGLAAEYYTTKEKLELLNQKKIRSEIHILSPFDNLIIQRKRLKDFFAFDYTIECYVPEAKRKFGYYCMPVLYGDEFIGKIDAKADRANKTFIIKNIFWEGKVKHEKLLQSKIKKLAHYCGCEIISGKA
ncbi:MAG: YcaQ family DNA glycosylase [Ignavibacteria bacterium]|nr:YcaQ family DNA glycosylase [Ignavibacteria bacterium]